MNHHAIEAKYPFRRTTQVQLRFNDIDALGHVNNSVYFQFFDLAKTEYFAGLEVNADGDIKYIPRTKKPAHRISRPRAPQAPGKIRKTGIPHDPAEAHF